MAGPAYVDPETGKDIGTERYAIGREWSRLQPGRSSDRYIHLSRAHLDRPAPTVTARAGGDGGVAGVTHPTEARRFTLRELRRICGFPDDFTLTGSYQQRWERLGRAVPPVMAAAIATAIRDRILGGGMKIIQRDWNREAPVIHTGPSPTIQARGAGGVFSTQIGLIGGAPFTHDPETGEDLSVGAQLARLAVGLEEGDETGVQMTDKPPYQVPSMIEIGALPWSGLTAASTFSGCGGSSLGYRMAGFRVLWASEFVPAARETYLANAAPYTTVDDRDIRDVSAQDVLGALGMGAGELDLLDGSPPCASFSTAGKRQEGWGKVKSYSDTAQRTDDLFYEYARLVRGIQPRVFVAENVSGLVKGTAKGYFIRIMGELRACGYRVQAKLLDAQWLGVPQARQRLIIIGVRDDLGLDPAFPRPLPYRYSVREALPWVLEQGDNGGFGGGAMRAATMPSGTIGATAQTGNGRFPPSAVRVIHDTSGQRSAGDVTDRPCPTVTVGVDAINSHHYQVASTAPVITHDPFAKAETHFAGGNVTDKPCLTVTTNSDHYQVRHAPGSDHLDVDPETGRRLGIRERKNTVPDGLGQGRTLRRFTLGELRRVCGFPDDFRLTGTYEQRWERLGRAVPPVMMAAIATAIRDLILLPARSDA